MRSDERGVSYSAFVSVVVVAILGVAGLVVDGGARAAADRRAEQAASAAARAAVDATSPQRAGGGDLNHTTALGAARRSLSVSGVAGDARVSGTRVTVTTSIRTPTVFLSIVGIRELTSSGSASAELAASR